MDPEKRFSITIDPTNKKVNAPVRIDDEFHDMFRIRRTSPNREVELHHTSIALNRFGETRFLGSADEAAGLLSVCF